jgi:hypothetical protein
VGGLLHEGDAPLGEVDNRGDHQRAGEDRGDGEQRAGPGRAGDHDEETDAVSDRESAEVAGCVGRRRLLVAEQRRDGNDDDLDGDDREEGAQHRRCRGAVVSDGGASYPACEVGWR